MKKVAVVLFVVIAAILGTHFIGRTPTQVALPLALIQIECQKDSLYIASEGHDMATVAGTTLAFPCVTSGASKDLQKQWAADDPAYRYSQSIYFLKRQDGRFEKSDIARSAMVSTTPDTRYAVQTTFRPHEGDHWKKPLLEDPGDRWHVQIDTPFAFRATGTRIEFVCHEYRNTRRRCGARVRSNSLYWDVFLYFAGPTTRESRAEVPHDLLEACELIAAHIVNQSMSMTNL